MQKKFPKYLMMFMLLIVFINRGLFIATPETEIYTCGSDTNRQEINSIVELLIELTTGKHNNIDEDGESSESYNTIKIVQPFIFQLFSQSLELWNNFSIPTKKIIFPFNERIPKLILYGQIDHPPQN